MVDKEDLWCPVAAEAAEKRCKSKTNDVIDGMAEMTEAEKARQVTESGTLAIRNTLFQDKIFFEPHLQVLHVI